MADINQLPFLTKPQWEILLVQLTLYGKRFCKDFSNHEALIARSLIMKLYNIAHDRSIFIEILPVHIVCEKKNSA